MRTKSWWGWGWADQALDQAGSDQLARRVSAFLPLDGQVAPVPDVERLRRPRVAQPPIEARCDNLARVSHSYGKAYRDVIRNLRNDFPNPPDWIAYPRNENEIEETLDWAAHVGAAIIPYGGGTSVVGGVEFRDPDRPFVTLDLGRMRAVVELDAACLAVRAQAGIDGPALEAALREKDLTLRHYPQSFEFSTLGGWLATRAGGHFATGRTRIDDFVESLRIVTPVGISESLRVPASGAGPSPDRFWLGSEGALGIITEAWMRVQKRPAFRSRATISFAEYQAGVAASKDLAQSGLMPANCRLLDPLESLIAADSDSPMAALLLAFESADHPVESALDRAIELCRAHGGQVAPRETSWRGNFLRAPYLRDALARLGVVVETFETACTWGSFEQLHAAVLDAVSPAIATCRFTHVYPDGPAPYFTVYAPGRRGAELEIWDELKARVSEAVVANGGTITHHHAIGRDHNPWYQRQRPEPFGTVLRAAKRSLDPQRLLNPGVLGL
ncbi:FAD-binding oxidoreductase [Allorhizocola rhizosphaerae]|uniref:FAD-binding oxidoreductase n=1 Tax=Allorhizocola rhizosphaerae TaxID=1872709 RepID=UPI000E3C6567|nr:FAD-binding oxidoreductase [Allorhizocola rhizosphaerae]